MPRRKEHSRRFTHDKVRLVEAFEAFQAAYSSLTNVRGITSERPIPGGIIELAREEIRRTLCRRAY